MTRPKPALILRTVLDLTGSGTCRDGYIPTSRIGVKNNSTPQHPCRNNGVGTGCRKGRIPAESSSVAPCSPIRLGTKPANTGRSGHDSIPQREGNIPPSCRAWTPMTRRRPPRRRRPAPRQDRSACGPRQDAQRPGKIAPRADRAKIDGPGRHGGFGGLGVGEGVGLGGRRSGVGGLGREVRHGRKSEIIKFQSRQSRESKHIPKLNEASNENNSISPWSDLTVSFPGTFKSP